MGVKSSRHSKLSAQELAAFPSPDIEILSMDPLLTTAPTPLDPVSDKLHLLWLQGCSRLHKRLSFNIVREVCSYLQKLNHLLAFTRGQAYFYDITLNRRRLLFTLDQEVDIDEATAYVFIQQQKVFLCGANRPYIGSIHHTGKSAFVFDVDGRVHQQCCMSDYRAYAGLFYDANRGSVYVFGGLNGPPGTISTCEKFLLDTCQWEALPDMNDGRYCVNPCEYESILYLCGGMTTSVETYDPRENVFRLIPEFSLFDDDSPCTSVVEDEILVVISKYHIYKWALKSKLVTYSQELPERNVWSNCPLGRWEGRVFVMHMGVCYRIKVETGLCEKETQVC